MHVAASQGAVVAGLVSERESGRLELGAEASFIPENGIGAAVSAVLTEAGSPGGEGIEFNYLSSNHGGAIAVAPAAGGGRAIAVSGVLPVRFAVAGAAPALSPQAFWPSLLAAWFQYSCAKVASNFLTP
jgi:hypothetical protein